MSSKGSASDAKIGAVGGLRVGVVGAGVMGSNHARVLAGLPGVTLVGIVDPLPEHRARATALAGCRAFAELDELFDEGVMPSPSLRPPICITISRWPASRATFTSCREAGRLDGGGGAGHRQRGEERRRDADGRPRRALQSGGRRHQAGDIRRGYSLDRHHARRAVSARNVQCRRGDRSRRARYRPDRWFTESDIVEVQPQLSSAVAEREDIALLRSAPPPACSPTSTPTG